MFQTLHVLLPVPIRKILEKLPQGIAAGIEEIRIREGRPLEIITANGYQFVTAKAELTFRSEDAYHPDKELCLQLLDMVTQHSLYTFEEELQKGYITIQGGHRIGLSGRTVLEHGRVKLIRDITGYNIRLAREIHGVGSSVLPLLVDQASSSIHHTLVLSPPQMGKTTLVRDLARLISSGKWPAGCRSLRGLKVGIVDERSELAACYKGVPRFDVGPRTDVMDGCPKAEGMMMMIRSMSPEVLVVDEIGRPEDAAAIMEAIHAGIRIIATAHGIGLGDAMQRPILKELMQSKVFNRIVTLSRGQGAVSRLETVHDAEGRKVLWSS